MTTAAEIEAAFTQLPAEEREPLLDRLCEVHPAPVPPLTPEQVAVVKQRVAEAERGEDESRPAEETMIGLRELICRIGAGEPADAVLAELKARRAAGTLLSGIDSPADRRAA